MGHISQRSNVPNFKKCIMSIWFRVPQVSVDSCKAGRAPYPPYHNPDHTEGIPSYQPVPTQPLYGIIPIVTFGPRPSCYVPATINSSSGSSSGTNISFSPSSCFVTDHYTFDAGVEISSVKEVIGQNYDADPCYIGVDCNDPWGDGKLYLKVNIQTDVYPTAQYWATGNVVNTQSSYFEANQLVSVVVTAPPPTSEAGWGIDPPPGGAACGQYAFYGGQENPTYTGRGWWDLSTVTRVITNTADDITDFVNKAKPEVIGGTSPTIVIKPGQWHHLIFSLDLSGSISGYGSWGGSGLWGVIPPTYTPGYWDSTLRMYCALDDVNYTLGDLPSKYWKHGTGAGGNPQGSGRPDNASPSPNEIMTQSIYDIFTLPDTGHPDVPSIVMRGTTGGFDPEQITISSAYYNGPKSSSFSLPKGLKVNGYDFGFPAGANITSTIWDVDMAEFQMWTEQSLDPSVESNRRLFISASGLPVNPNVAAKTLGKQQVLLHKRARWKKGHNLGTLGVDPSGNDIPAGQFRPVGTILTFNPDPSLHGPQTPPPGPSYGRARAGARNAPPRLVRARMREPQRSD